MEKKIIILFLASFLVLVGCQVEVEEVPVVTDPVYDPETQEEGEVESPVEEPEEEVELPIEEPEVLELPVEEELGRINFTITTEHTETPFERYDDITTRVPFAYHVVIMNIMKKDLVCEGVHYTNNVRTDDDFSLKLPPNSDRRSAVRITSDKGIVITRDEVTCYRKGEDISRGHMESIERTLVFD